MSAVAHPPDLHPLQGVASCLGAVSAALADLPAGALPPGDPDAVAGLVGEVARVERQVRELRLRLARAAEDSRAREADASSGTDAWLAQLTGSTAAVMRGGLWLARQLEERYPVVREAFAAGDLGEAQARVIVNAAEDVPGFVSAVDRATAVAHLVDQAVSRRLSASALRRRARRMLAVVDEAYADHHEAALLAKQERRAAGDTWLTLHDNGDGSWTGRFVLPDLQAHLLMTRLQHLSSPRRLSRNRAGEAVTDETVVDYPGPSWSEGLGAAFCELVENLPADGLTGHGRVGATIAIHLDHQHLLDGLGAARLDSGAEITAGEARRLACGAGIVPMVYDGASLPLDLGRASRLHSKGQRIALSAVHDTCAAEGCQRPFAWTEVHHLRPWAQGGPTDLTNAVPLCGWHHHRAHDHHYDLTRLTSGEIRFRRRHQSGGRPTGSHATGPRADPDTRPTTGRWPAPGAGSPSEPGGSSRPGR